MKMLRFLIMAALLLGAAPVLGAEASPVTGTAFLSGYVQTLYDEESELPVNQVKSALQASDGYMWFAGYQGLMRYDGVDTKIFSQEDGFPTLNVNILFEDDGKNLWVGTNDNGIALYRDRRFTVWGLEQGLPSSSVRDIAQDEEGNVYAATAGGVAVIAPDGELFPHPRLTGVFATHIEHIGGGRLLCLLNDGRIILFNRNAIIQEFEGVGGSSPLSLFFSKKTGTLYIGTAAEEVLITDGELSSYQTVTLPYQTQNSFYEDSAGRIWVCSDVGLGYFSGGRFFPIDGLLMNNSIEAIYEDYEGSLWVCSSRQGLLQLARSRFTNISFAAGLPDYTVNTTAVFQGDLYIGADEGLIILRNGSPITNELTEMLEGIRIRSMLTDSGGRLWICTYEKYGVLAVDNDGGLTSFNVEDGLASGKTRCILELSDGGFAVGMSGGVSIIREGRIVKGYGASEGLTNDVILSLCEKDGVLYAGSDGGGIYAIEGDNITNYTEADGLAAGVILRMAVIGDGVWVSTGNNLCYLDNSGIRLIDKLMAYDDSVFDIREIGGDIWFLQSKSVNICRADSLLSDSEPVITQLQRKDGLSSTITANSWNALSEDGTLFISTGKGVLAIGTDTAVQGGAVPFIGISEVLADGKPVALGESISLPSDTRRVDIRIALLSYASKGGTLSYMLEGFDSEIKTVERNHLPHVSYTNLKGGKYIFRLYGTSASGIQSPETELIINKEYTPLEMPLTRVLFAALTLGLLALLVRLVVSRRTRTAVRQRQEYKEITGQALSVIAAIADSKNEYTTGHSRRVAEYSKLAGQRMGLSEDELEALYYAALLHDIGKMSIPDSILNKRQRVTAEEYEIIKNHVLIGGELLSGISVIQDISTGARYHHERIDGMGYAEGLKGDEVPLLARIVSVSNAFDSMLSDRPYRKALSLEEVQSELLQNAGTQFDAELVAVFIAMINEGVVPL